MKIDTSHENIKNTAAAPDEIVDDSQMLCDDFIESFMRGNFSRVSRTLEKLDHLKTQNIRQLLTRQESELQ